MIRLRGRRVPGKRESYGGYAIEVTAIGLDKQNFVGRAQIAAAPAADAPTFCVRTDTSCATADEAIAAGLSQARSFIDAMASSGSGVPAGTR